METKELYYPQISAQAGSYTFEEGVELEIYSSKSSYYDWAKIRFTSQFRPKLSLKKKDPATIQLGYDGTLEDVFTGFVSGNYDGGTYANEVALKDEMLLMEETIINDTFLDTTPQELISYFLAQAGLSKMKLSSKTYPTRKMLPIRRQTAVQAINAVNAAWGLRVPFFFSGGVFYWDEKPEQKKVYTFERGNQIFQKEHFEEHYHPVPQKLLLDKLARLSYEDIEVTAFPVQFGAFDPEKSEWYCVLARKAK